MYRHLAFALFLAAALTACTGAPPAGDKSAAGDDENAAMGLRKMILTEVPEGNEAVVVMDLFIEEAEAIASVMSSTEGDASIYLSTGGAMIGGGEHKNVNEAARAFARLAVGAKGHLNPAGDSPLPPKGRVRFYLRTREGLFMAEAAEAELTGESHPLSPLYKAGQEVITQYQSVRGS